ncbi:MAG: AMP-binding protein, partial [Bacteroidota bacterium]
KQFMAGIAYYLGLKKLGAGIVRLGVDTLQMHWNTIFRLRPTYLIAVPSFVARLIDYAKQHEIDFASSSVKKIICIGENIRDLNLKLNKIGQRITSQWQVQLFSTYASTEMATAFTECTYRKGGHHNEDLLIVEVLDANNEAVAPGEIGELTVTTLGIEGLPLLRYKTGDLVKTYNDDCACGSSALRISPVVGRTAQRIKYKGTTLYPSAILDLLNKFQSINDMLIQIDNDNLANDRLTIHLATHEHFSLTEVKSSLKSTLRVVPEIVIHNSLQPLRKLFNVDKKRKPVKVIDCR